MNGVNQFALYPKYRKIGGCSNVVPGVRLLQIQSLEPHVFYSVVTVIIYVSLGQYVYRF